MTWAEYKKLADRFRRGEQLTGDERAQLLEGAIGYSNYALIEALS